MIAEQEATEGGEDEDGVVIGIDNDLGAEVDTDEHGDGGEHLGGAEDGASVVSTPDEEAPADPGYNPGADQGGSNGGAQDGQPPATVEGGGEVNDGEVITAPTNPDEAVQPGSGTPPLPGVTPGA